MTVESDAASSRARPGATQSHPTRALPRGNPTTRTSRLTILYDRCFSRIRIGEKKATPTLIQVDCRESTPLSAARRISRVCSKIGRGDLIELLTNDLAAVVAALSWCRATGGRVERMESASGGYVLDITPDGGETIPARNSTHQHMTTWSHNLVSKGLSEAVRGHPTMGASSNRDRGRRIEP